MKEAYIALDEVFFHALMPALKHVSNVKLQEGYAMYLNHRLYQNTFIACTSLAILIVMGCSAAENRSSAVAQKTQSQPVNVVIILSDDQGYNSLSCAGATDFKTPNLNRLASQGVRCTQFYTSAPVCSPTRAALLTGVYQQRIGRQFDWVVGGLGAGNGLPPTTPTLPQMLNKRNYATGIMGKWHLGGIPKQWPTRFGFDEFKGFTGGNLDYWLHDDVTRKSDLWDGEKPLKAQGYLTDLITEWSVDFLRRHQDHPFFLYIPYNAPHWPYQGYEQGLHNINRAPGGNHRNWCVGGGSREIYRSMMERLDRGIGRILSTLDELNLSNNTLVIFFSDNGGDPPFANNKPLRGHKTQLYEGGIRVPCIFRWPGRIPADTLSDQPMIVMDITATVLAATQTPRDNRAQPADGINVLPFLTGRAANIPRRFFWYAQPPGKAAQTWRAIRDGDWKMVQIGTDRQLYNLKEDIAEQNNHADKLPDKLNELSNTLARWENSLPPKN